jgi:hypothetical protein
MTSYRYLFYDVLTNLPKAELPLSGVSYSSILNNAGALTATISARHAKATQDVISPWNTAIYVEREGAIVWGGILWRANVQSGTEESTLSLGANEFWSYFQENNNRGRYIRDTKSYTDADQLFIARDIINYAQNTGIHGPTASIGVTVGSELTTDGGGIQQLRTRTYNSWERQVIGKVVEQLAALDNGFEFFIDCDYAGSTINKVFRLYYPIVPDAPGIRFDYPTNVISYTLPIDATKAAKKVDAIGAGEGIDMAIQTVEDTTLLQYPMREATFSYKDVSQADTLLSHATSDLNTVRQPQTIPTLICRVNVPELTPGSFRCGANVQVNLQDGWVNIQGGYRIVQFEVRVDDDGGESMTVRLNDEDVLT